MPARILDEIQSRARRSSKRIALGDAPDERILRAAREASEGNLADIVLVGDAAMIRGAAERSSLSLEGIQIASASAHSTLELLADRYFDRRREKLRSLDEA